MLSHKYFSAISKFLGLTDTILEVDEKFLEVINISFSSEDSTIS
jgi:hypothetical protein